jgi:trehalose 6-phosphate synthase/phosphatase
MASQLAGETREKLISDYSKSSRSLVLLDYDGTLVSFADRPEKAQPDDELLALLGAIAKPSTNEVVIISGRDKATLEDWLSSINVAIIAEHGAWIRKRGSTWRTIEPMEGNWKKEVRPVLEDSVKRVAGSFVEEKDFSLAWHYRKADAVKAETEAEGLKNAVSPLCRRFTLQILKGSKVIEVRNRGINKGRAARTWLSRGSWDFILALGDDVTDEDTFAALPPWAYSIKVGSGSSRAKFFLDSVDDVRSLLSELVPN